MSTRGFIGFQKNSKIKITYNHCDSYPEELGRKIVDFIRTVMKEDRLQELKEEIFSVEFVEGGSIPTKDQQEMYSHFADCSVSSKKLSDWYVLLRHTQGVFALDSILEKKLFHLIDYTENIKDSSLRYGYVLNFDTDSIEFYKSGNILVKSLSFESLTILEKYSGTKWIDFVYLDKAETKVDGHLIRNFLIEALEQYGLVKKLNLPISFSDINNNGILIQDEGFLIVLKDKRTYQVKIKEI